MEIILSHHQVMCKKKRVKNTNAGNGLFLEIHSADGTLALRTKMKKAGDAIRFKNSQVGMSAHKDIPTWSF